MKDNWYYEQLFNIAILQKSAQEFEDFFCKIMKAENSDFQKVKAYGSKGDNSCDGLNNTTGVFYLCYAPEDLNKISTQKNAIAKIKSDISGIISKWSNIHKIEYVINDRFRGLSPDIIKLINDLKSQTNYDINIFSMETLRDICLSLNDADKKRILGYYPDFESTKIYIDFATISNIIKFLDEHPLLNYDDDNLVVPDYSEKIAFNNLSPNVAKQLNFAKYYNSKVDDFFEQSPSYDKEELRNYIREIYLCALRECDRNRSDYSDQVYFYILKKIAYDMSSKTVVENCIVIISTFFESCDVFKEPECKVKK